MIPTADILGVPVQGFRKKELLEALERDFSQGKRARIVTINNEILMQARDDEAYRKLLVESEYRIPDSTGLTWASAFLAKPLTGPFRWVRAYWRAWWMLVGLLLRPAKYRTVFPETIRGSELTVDLAERCARRGYGLYLLGAGPGVAVEAARRLQERFPGLEVTADPADPKPGHEATAVERINRKQARVVLVAYGAPEQEAWIGRNIRSLKAPVVAMGIGGSLDYLAGGKSVKGGGTAKPPPDWVRQRGLEWSWRGRHPSRWRRIFVALPLFVHAVVRQKLDSTK